MSRSSFTLDDRLYDYLLKVSLREAPILARLREETARHPMAQMQIAPEQGQFIQWLLKLMGARRGIEVGVFTGYSALCAALAMGEDGQLLACDVSEEYTAVAQRYWAEAGVAGRIDLQLAPALQTLDAELVAGRDGHYDYAFIDADKPCYADYYEHCLQLLRPGGVILVDNVLWSGRVADPAEDGEDTVALRAFNQKLANDNRIDLSMIPLADGLSMCRKC